MTHPTDGIDISKDHLDAYSAPRRDKARFPNDPAGFQELIAWIGPEAARVAYEPTGPFHRDLEDALLKAGLHLYAINPYHARCFARSRGLGGPPTNGRSGAASALAYRTVMLYSV